jgi:hypothetical protein
MPPGDERTTEVTFVTVTNSEQVDGIAAGSMYLYVFGIVEYKDFRNRQQSLQFRTLYVPRSGRFADHGEDYDP